MLARVMLVGWFLALGACSTQRTLRIESDPPGAEVWVNGVKQSGRTPVQFPFVHYQTFEVRIEKQGYRSFAGTVQLGNETDGYPLIDLPSELSVKQRTFTQRIPLEPLPPRPDEAGVQAVLGLASTFREQARTEAEAGRARFRPAR